MDIAVEYQWVSLNQWFAYNQSPATATYRSIYWSTEVPYWSTQVPTEVLPTYRVIVKPTITSEYYYAIIYAMLICYLIVINAIRFQASFTARVTDCTQFQW